MFSLEGLSPSTLLSFTCGAPHLDTATVGFSLSPPAERGERVGARGTNAMADKDGTVASSPHPSPPKEEREIEPSAGGSVKTRCASESLAALRVKVPPD
jgi:hypothetical protein